MTKERPTVAEYCREVELRHALGELTTEQTYSINSYI